MKKSLFTLLLLVLMGSVVFAQVKVTFRVNMGAQVFNKVWVPGSDSVCVRGDFQALAGDPGGDWQGSYFKMALVTDTIYAVTATFPATAIGTSHSYKYVTDAAGWEGASNRPFNVPTKDSVLAVNWYNDDSTHKTAPIVTNTINFTADISAIEGTGVGYFDPSQDSLQVVGLDWNGKGTVVSGNRTMTEDLMTAGLFTTTMVVKGNLGDSVEWKFKAYPDARYTNSGYETQANNRKLALIADGSTVNLAKIVPQIEPIAGTLANPLSVLIECNMNTTPAPVNAKDGRKIPLDSLAAIGIKGSIAPFGSWGGSWIEGDTAVASRSLFLLLDDGTNGDKVKGDKVYSTTIVLPAGTTLGTVQYKFAALYPAAGVDGGASTPLDNEGGYGANHSFKLTATGPTHLRNDWANVLTAVKDVASLDAKSYKLYQNYPNPFNPSTTINFSLPVDGNVVLKVYNILGKEVATLMNGFERAGGKEVTFNASNLPSGMYIYTIKAGNFTSSKKMMLLK
jgi:hypothetical protein